MVLLVLLVEDEALVSMTVEAALEDAGFLIRTAASGKQAMEILDTEAESFNALITDVNLGPVDGWAVARHARELEATIPVIYTTGDSAHQWTAYGVPGSVLVEKPFAPIQIVTAVSSLLNVSDPGRLG
jgi:DNA-binding response OmpR family regulator